jgi:hypothetical protein
MKTSDFNSPLTSAKLNENMNKMFGVRVKLENYSREQLEDMRNRLRTRVFQQEGSAGINDLLTNETYQKDKAMLDLLNTRIKEMLGEDIKKLRDKMDQLSEAKKGSKSTMANKDHDGDGRIETGKAEVMGSRMKAAAKAGKPFKEAQGDDARARVAQQQADRDDPMSPAYKDKKEKSSGVTRVKGTSYGNQAQEKEKEKELEEGKSCSKGHTKMTKGCKECAGMYEAEATDKKALPSMAHVEEMCKKGMSEAEICKMHPDCDQKKLKQMVADCKEKLSKGVAEGSMPMKKVNGKSVPAFAADGKGPNDTTKKGAAPKKGVNPFAKKKVKESFNQFKHNVQFVNESLGYLLQEDEEGKAKAITAAGDMVNDFTSWMQRVGQYQTKTMIELADAIKADFGAQEAETFKASVGPALSSTLETLTQQREAVSNAVAVLAGEATAEVSMGMEPEMPAEPGMDMSAPDEMNPEPAGDEFGAADAAAGMGTTGREMRESKFARKLAESHNIMASLAK